MTSTFVRIDAAEKDVVPAVDHWAECSEALLATYEVLVLE